MTKITEEVHRILSNDVAIENCLALHIVNMRALAKFLIEKYRLDASVDAVISAIRRFDARRGYRRHRKKLKELFSNASIHTKNNLVAVNIEGRSSVKRCIEHMGSVIDMDRGDTLRIVQGEAFMKIIIDEYNLGKMRDVLVATRNTMQDGLVELTISTHKDTDLDHTKGVMARITNELAMNNVNILEFVFSMNDIHIYVDKNDAMQAQATLLDLSAK